MVGDAGGADGFHILCGDYIPVQTIADQLLQLHLDIFHIRAGLGEKELCGVLGDFFPFAAQDTGNPAFQGILILYREFCHITLGLHGLIQFTPFIHFAFREHKKGGVVGVCQVFRQLFPTGFEEPGIFEEHNTALCQKRKRLCQIDDLSQGEILPLIEMGIHLVAVLTQRFTQTGRVLVLQITFLSVEQVDLFEIAGFDVFIDPLHELILSGKMRLLLH